LAGYRPKSLDELNSLYDKSINVKNEIYKKASDLEVKSEQFVPATAQTDSQPEPEKSREEAATEEISGLVDDFIKSFGAPVPIKKVRPATITATAVKPVSAPKAPEAKANVQESAVPSQAYAPVSEKPRLIRSNERNELFEDYKKVMDDEGEDENSRSRRGRRKGKKLFEKKHASAPEEAETKPEAPEAGADEAPAEISYEGIMPEEKEAEPEIPETLDNIDAVIEKVLGRPLPKTDESEQPEEEIIIQPEEEEPFETEEAQPEAEADTVSEVPETVGEAEEIHEEAEEPEVAEVAETDDEDFDEAPFEYLAEVYRADDADENEAHHDEYSAEYVISEQKEEAPRESEEAEEQNEEARFKAPSKKRFAGKNLLLVLLFLVLLLATAVSAIKAFSGINSDTLMLDNYYLYTADNTFAQAGISKGDLVVVSHEDIKEGDVFAYKKGDGEYGFAKLESILNEESVVADTDGQKSIVFRNTLRGVFFKSYPVIGTAAALIISQYPYVEGALLLLAAILLLIIVLAFRSKKEKPVKNSKKKDTASELEDVQGSDEATEGEKSPYDAVEDDFKYLIQEDGDDFDVYRKDYSEETDEDGLPVYQADDYKYEPDEYVNN